METKSIVKSILEESIALKKQFFADDINIDAVVNAASAMVECYKRGGKIVVFGNGGSAADSQHLAAELVVRFEKERKAIPCISLTTDTSILTAVTNDYDFNRSFSRQLEALLNNDDIVVAISTSGNSRNVIEAVKVARDKKVPVIALTGSDGGKLLGESDISIVVNSDCTARIQELHITIIHIICKIVEDALF